METKGLLDTIKDWLKEKSNSSVYIVFVLAFISWNWKFFFALFFSEQNVYGQTRINYAISVSHSLNEYIISTPYVVLNDILLGFCNFIIHFFEPILLTYFIVWYLPHINNVVHKKSLTFYFNRKSEFDLQNSIYQKSKTRELQVQKKETDLQISTLEYLEKKSQKKTEIQERINEKLSDEEKWLREFIKYRHTPAYQSLSDLKNVIYNHSGMTREWSQVGGYRLIINSDILASSDSNGLITINGKDGEEKIELTPKGKFFMAKFLDNQKK